ncbi:MAG TPA: DUF1800 domain-containing protein [Anaerolineae bacterium]|nr:DUF1800 domain-containing protein [Anaerolineae bacterium]
MAQPTVPTARRDFLISLSPSQLQTKQRAMRSPENPVVTAGFGRAITMPSLAALTLNRAGFGHAAGDIAAFEALGADDQARLTAWVDQQLAPDLIDDSACDERIANGVYVTHEKTAAQLWSEHYRNDVWAEVVRPGLEAISLKFLRAMYSKRQLKEVLVDFWHNHFSIYWEAGASWSMLMQYDRDCIRPNVLGSFRTMLGAITKSPSMMFYLNQVESSQDGPNENFARELLELHTLGAEHYYGTMAPEDVPGYPNPVGYVEEDVFALTKALTGWTIRYRWWDDDFGDTGEFFTYQPWHNTEAKQLLGQPIAAGQTALAEGEAILDMLAAHPATATFIARKLCRRLVADFPPETLVQSTAQVFLANLNAADQLAQVVRHILLSAEFSNTWGAKIKRPFGVAVSALRAAGCTHTFQTRQQTDDWTDTFFWLFSFTGHNPHEWHPPNGYPDFAPVWRSTSSLVMRWRVLAWLADDEDNGLELLPIYADTLATGLRSPNAIVDYWIGRIFGYTLSAETRDTLVAFLAQGRNPAYNMTFDPIDWQADPQDWDLVRLWDRVRSLVGLMFMTPEFQLK